MRRCLKCSLVVAVSVVVWSVTMSTGFVLPFPHLGAVFIGDRTLGYNVEDGDGGFHGVTLVFRAIDERPAPFFIHNHYTKEERAEGYTYVGEWWHAVQPKEQSDVH
jgi:hypothetical protein